jgi:hypothetical protein
MVTLFASLAWASIPAAWDLHEHVRHRWVIESEVMLTHHLWLYADRNRDVRARGVGLQLVLDCTGQAPGARVGHLACTIDDASATGVTYPSERGRMQKVLEEMDAKLTGASLDLVMRPDGRLRTIRLVTTRLQLSQNQRTRSTDEALRTLVVRAVSAFDVDIPDAGFEEGGWPQYESTLLTLPTLQGTAGGGELVHRASRWEGDRVLVATQGQAMLIEGSLLDEATPMFLDTRITGYTVFDLAAGRVAEARWETLGEPTASAGPTQRAYAARVSVRALTLDEEVRLAPTQEVVDPWMGPTNLGS